MNGEVLLALQRATHVTLAALSIELAAERLVPGEFNALANLSEGDSMTVGELGGAVGAKATTLTSILDRLESRGLILRERDSEDRRVVIVRLTGDGAAVAERIRRAYAAVEERVLPDDGVSLADGLAALATGVQG